MAVTLKPEDETQAGPSAHGDPMGTPTMDEKVLWKGQPDLAVLSRTAFHTRKVGLYFVALIAISAILGNITTAIVCAVLGVAGVAVLHTLAWVSRRTTLYILTDTRLIMRIGMALETRINVPLKHVLSADLKMRGKEHGDIALKIGGERLLGFFLLWPHTRPWHFARPEPMLRGIPDAQKVAALLADACANVVQIERNLTEINVSHPQSVQQQDAAARPSRGPSSLPESSSGGLEGAPA